MAILVLPIAIYLCSMAVPAIVFFVYICKQKISVFRSFLWVLLLWITVLPMAFIAPFLFISDKKVSRWDMLYDSFLYSGGACIGTAVAFALLFRYSQKIGAAYFAIACLIAASTLPLSWLVLDDPVSNFFGIEWTY